MNEVAKCRDESIGDQRRLTSYDHVMRSVPGFDALSREMTSLLSSLKFQSTRVLEFGSGTGLFTCRLIRSNGVKELLCVDPDAAACEHLATRLRADKQLRVKWQIRAISAEALQEEGGFDVVVARFVFHHIADDEKVQFLSIARRALRTNGVLILGDMTLPHYENDARRTAAVNEYYESTLRVATSIGDRLLVRDQIACRIDDIRQHGEYKVCRCRVLDAMRKAGFTSIRSRPCATRLKSSLRWPGLIAYAARRKD